MSAVYTLSDIHGHYPRLVHLLQTAGLIDTDLRWTGGSAQLYVLGDFVDRGPNGIGAIELIMRLQGQAARAGGAVQALLGNHDLLLLATYRLGRFRKEIMTAYQSGRDLPFLAYDWFTASWLRNGGNPADLCRMSGKHAVWLTHLPLMARVGDTLLIHADALFYQRRGDTLEQINTWCYHTLTNGDEEDWLNLLDDFSEHEAFLRPGGAEHAALFLKMFHARRLIHGHTPINSLAGYSAAEPLVYANGRCVNIDGGIYLGGEGLIYQIA
jgi:hypothetical protein